MKTYFVCDLFAHEVHEQLVQDYRKTLNDFAESIWQYFPFIFIFNDFTIVNKR